MDEDGIVWIAERSTRAGPRPVRVYVRQPLGCHTTLPQCSKSRSTRRRWRPIFQYYGWQGLTKYVQQYLTISPSPDNQRPRKPRTCWKQVAIDEMGQYPETERGKRFVVVTTDLFFRWVEARPVPRADKDTILAVWRRKCFAAGLSCSTHNR